MPAVAVGCPVILKANKDVPKGASNGAAAEVTKLNYRNGKVVSIQIRILSTGFLTNISRTIIEQKFYNMSAYYYRYLRRILYSPDLLS